MGEYPLSVATSALISDGKVLLLKRQKNPYRGFWALPSGKVQKHEEMAQAAIRQVIDDTKITSQFKGYHGFVSKHLLENGKISHHFLLHLFSLEPLTKEVTKTQQEFIKWFDLKHLGKMKRIIVPSDFMMIEKMIKKQEKNYYNCVLEKKGKKHMLRKFE